MRTRVGGLVLVLLALAFGACAGDDMSVSTTATTVDAGPSVKLNVGKLTSGAVDFQMTAKGITIEPAGEVMEGHGHFHVIADKGCVPTGEVIPKDADHVHLGKGQTEGKIYLGPGDHTLCLQVGDGAHHALAITDTRNVTISVNDKIQWCGITGELNDLYTELAALGADFPAQQLAYANVQRLLAQLESGIDTVPTSDRENVAADLESQAKFATAFVTATDAKSAEANVQKAFPRGRTEDTPGRAWIAENCTPES